MDQSAEDLRCKFTDLLEQHFQEPNRRWLAVWNLFAKHPWYKGQLNGCAHYVLEQSRLPADLEPIRKPSEERGTGTFCSEDSAK